MCLFITMLKITDNPFFYYMETKNDEKNSQYFVCEKCYYNRYKNIYLLEK
jgi:hypothetical protein